MKYEFEIFSLTGIGAHLYRCFTHDQWVFLIAGAIFFPISIVHGWGVLLGIW